MTTDNAAMLKELTANMNEHGQKCIELLMAYELACLGYDLQWQRSKDAMTRVLQEHEFYADMDCDRCGVKAGDRVMDEDTAWLLSKEDFERVQELQHPILVAEGITDENGYYIEKWADIRCDARRELVDALIETLPAALRPVFDRNKWNVVQMDKLIKLFKNNLKKKEAA